MISAWPDLNESASPAQYVATQKAHGARLVILLLISITYHSSRPILIIERVSYIKLMQETGQTMELPLELPLPTPSPSIQAALVDAAHEEGMLVVAHALNFEDTLLVLNSGVDGMMHACSEAPPNQELVGAFQKNNVFLVPTLVTLASCTGEEQESREQFAQRLEPTGKEFMCSCMKIMISGPTIDNAYQQVRELRAAGLDIVA